MTKIRSHGLLTVWAKMFKKAIPGKGGFEGRIPAAAAAAAAAKSLHSCPTLCDPIDGSPPDLPAPGILQARTLEWVAK